MFFGVVGDLMFDDARVDVVAAGFEAFASDLAN
jgi:hypothetical protein